jgi:hypothetical protein
LARPIFRDYIPLSPIVKLGAPVLRLAASEAATLDARNLTRDARRAMRTPSFILCLSVLAWTTCAKTWKPVVFENPRFRYTISAKASNVEFVDRATGTNYLRATEASPCAFVRIQGKSIPLQPVAVLLRAGRRSQGARTGDGLRLGRGALIPEV